MSTLITQLSSILPVSTILEKELSTIVEQKKIKKGQSILTIGERCRDLFFVEKGILRGFYFKDGKEITNWFAQENEFATCFYSFIAEKNSVEEIQALEDCLLVRLSYADLQSLYQRLPETERIGRIIMENYYLKLEERLLSIQFKSAKERYQTLLDIKSPLLKRVPLGHIATYLGISQETLSRMRAEV